MIDQGCELPGSDQRPGRDDHELRGCRVRILKGFRLKDKGCEKGATLGWMFERFSFTRNGDLCKGYWSAGLRPGAVRNQRVRAGPEAGAPILQSSPNAVAANLVGDLAATPLALMRFLDAHPG